MRPAITRVIGRAHLRQRYCLPWLTIHHEHGLGYLLTMPRQWDGQRTSLGHKRYVRCVIQVVDPLVWGLLLQGRALRQARRHTADNIPTRI
jgi:hypothetical protein